MAIITKITQPGNALISTLNGKVILNTGTNKLNTYDTDGKTILDADSSGLDTYDTDGKNMFHSGYDPEGTSGVTAIARQGEDAIASS